MEAGGEALKGLICASGRVAVGRFELEKWLGTRREEEKEAGAIKCLWSCRAGLAAEL